MVKREKIEFEDSMVSIGYVGVGCGISKKFQYVFTSDTIIDTESIEITHLVEYPDSIKEFREKHNLSKEEVLEFLNNNYNK